MENDEPDTKSARHLLSEEFIRPVGDDEELKSSEGLETLRSRLIEEGYADPTTEELSALQEATNLVTLLRQSPERFPNGLLAYLSTEQQIALASLRDKYVNGVHSSINQPEPSVVNDPKLIALQRKLVSQGYTLPTTQELRTLIYAMRITGFLRQAENPEAKNVRAYLSRSQLENLTTLRAKAPGTLKRLLQALTQGNMPEV